MGGTSADGYTGHTEFTHLCLLFFQIRCSQITGPCGITTITTTTTRSSSNSGTLAASTRASTAEATLKRRQRQTKKPVTHQVAAPAEGRCREGAMAALGGSQVKTSGQYFGENNQNYIFGRSLPKFLIFFVSAETPYSACSIVETSKPLRMKFVW